MFATASSSCLLAADLDLFGGGGISDDVGAGLSAADLGGLAKREGGGIVFGGCRYWFSDVAETGMVGAAVGGTVGHGDSVPPPSLLFLFAAGVPEVADGDAA